MAQNTAPDRNPTVPVAAPAADAVASAAKGGVRGDLCP
jgi:hypothetical protein